MPPRRPGLLLVTSRHPSGVVESTGVSLPLSFVCVDLSGARRPAASRRKAS
jgi:hypothetical protein